MNWEARVKVVEAENERLRDEIAALRTALGLTRDYPPMFGMNFTAMEGQMLSMMLKRGYVPKTAFMSAIYDARPDGDKAVEPKIIDVMICRMRSKLKELGVKIETKWGEGYFIPAADKQTLRRALGEEAA